MSKTSINKNTKKIRADSILLLLELERNLFPVIN